MKKRILAFATCASMILGMTGCGNGQSLADSAKSKQNVANAASGNSSEATLMGDAAASIRFKVGTTTAPEGHYVKGLQEMQKLLQEYSNGEMTLDIYPNSQLGNERDMMENVSMNVQDMCLISTGPIPNFVADFAVLDLPYIFDDEQDAYQVLDGEIGQSLLKQLDKQGIYGVGFWENGFRQVTNNKKEIKTPDDLKGMKIRTMENNVHIATYEKLGATATPMAWSEIFTALQQGTVDGQENPIAIIESAKVYEVQKYISLIDLFYSPTVLMIGKSAFEGLSEEQQKTFVKAADEAKKWQREYSQSYNQDALKTMQDAGVTITKVDKAAWKAKSTEIYSDLKSTGLSLNQSLVDQLTK